MPLLAVSLPSQLVRAIRAARGDRLATAWWLNAYAATRAGATDHAGFYATPPAGHGMVGEILGWIDAPDAVPWLMERWLASPTHRRILMDPSWRWVGAAVRRRGTWTYAAVEFSR